jgi:hypothetical protein
MVTESGQLFAPGEGAVSGSPSKQKLPSAAMSRHQPQKYPSAFAVLLLVSVVSAKEMGITPTSSSGLGGQSWLVGYCVQPDTHVEPGQSESAEHRLAGLKPPAQQFSGS